MHSPPPLPNLWRPTAIMCSLNPPGKLIKSLFRTGIKSEAPGWIEALSMHREQTSNFNFCPLEWSVMTLIPDEAYHTLTES
jgi:hypothetical protein